MKNAICFETEEFIYRVENSKYFPICIFSCESKTDPNLCLMVKASIGMLMNQGKCTTRMERRAVSQFFHNFDKFKRDYAKTSACYCFDKKTGCGALCHNMDELDVEMSKTALDFDIVKYIDVNIGIDFKPLLDAGFFRYHKIEGVRCRYIALYVSTGDVGTVIVGRDIIGVLEDIPFLKATMKWLVEENTICL